MSNLVTREYVSITQHFQERLRSIKRVLNNSGKQFPSTNRICSDIKIVFFQ